MKQQIYQLEERKGHVTSEMERFFLTFSLFKYMYAGRFIVSPSTSYDKWSNFKLRLGDKFCFPLFTNFYNSSKELESVLFTSGVQSV